MRAVVQRVKKASVRVDGTVTGAIEKGLLVFAGIEKGDDARDLKTQESGRSPPPCVSTSNRYPCLLMNRSILLSASSILLYSVA